MGNISKRIGTIEKKLSLGQHEKQIQLFQFIICEDPTNSTGKDIDKLGPVETWITYQEQLQAEENAPIQLDKDDPSRLGAVIIMDLDVEKEYQARQRKTTKNNQFTKSEV